MIIGTGKVTITGTGKKVIMVSGNKELPVTCTLSYSYSPPLQGNYMRTTVR